MQCWQMKRGLAELPLSSPSCSASGTLVTALHACNHAFTSGQKATDIKLSHRIGISVGHFWTLLLLQLQFCSHRSTPGLPVAGDASAEVHMDHFLYHTRTASLILLWHAHAAKSSPSSNLAGTSFIALDQCWWQCKPVS